MGVLTGPDDGKQAPSAAGLILRALPTAAFIVGPQDEILVSNAAADALLAAPARGEGPRALADCPSDLRIALASGLAELRGDPPPRSVQRVLVRQDGYPITVVLTPVPGLSPGRPAHVMVAAAGGTGLSALVGAGSPESTGPVKDFLAMLAHELRNPLAPILHALHIVRQRVTGDRLALHAVEVADRQARHQARLLDDLLDVSRVLLGKIALHMVHVDLGDVLRQAVDACDLMLRARAQRITMGLPDGPLPVHGDPDRLEQAVKNLLSNASRYSDPGKDIWITAERTPEMAVVRVRDEGMGIDQAQLPHVFDLFFQAESSLARSEGGLGLGLTLAHHIVEMHNGVLLGRSAGRDRGSEFEVRLPLAPALEEATTAAALAGLAAPPQRSLRILAIEDNRDARQMLRMLLELRGHVVDDARDGRSGIKAASATAPDVVLIDIGLPDLSGYEVARALRKRLGARVRLIALTGYGDASARRLADEAGFDRHLLKPVSPDQLMLAIESG